eukprot:TRINITY_DN33176_c0_g1_i1.p1 TRINITY_DN33176_c0_g1~~TRINITY_DN33176_c0_g1_i1.p1  ORF type:complete len:1106 (+),score=144.55 TRINITY_DN33176_c0_g1_i1:99-3416(+)
MTSISKTSQKSGKSADREFKKQQIDKEKALEFKNKGNLKFQQGEYQAAIYLFTKGIELDPNNPTNYIFFSNRSAAFFALPDYKKALEDAETVLKLKPDWPKGYSRKGAALVGCKKLDEAIETYKDGLHYDPANQLLLEGLEVAQNALEASKNKGQDDMSVSKPHYHEHKRHKDKDSTGTKRGDTQNAGAHTPPRHQSHRSPSKASSTKQATGPFGCIASLPRSAGAAWHIEVVHDRIWLFDGTSHYRPQTAFLFDEQKATKNPVFLAIQQHHNNVPWKIDELADLLVRTCNKFRLQPENVNVSGLDNATWAELSQAFEAANIACTNNEAAGHLGNTIQNHIAGEEATQEEEWAKDPQGRFASVIWKRKQRGMLKMPGTNPHMVGGLLHQASEFWKAEVAKDFDKHLTIQLKSTGETSVATIVNTGTSNFGVAKFNSVDEIGSDKNKVQVSYLFSDKIGIPFEDVDDIKRFEWEIPADNAYPLPLVYNPDHTTIRPGAEDLKWFELAFGAITQFVTGVWRNPASDKASAYQLVIDTYAGPVDVVVQAPEPEATPRETAPAEQSAERTASPPRQPPSSDEFVAADSFQGRRIGFVFRIGDYGLGYYKDDLETRAAAQNATLATRAPDSPVATNPAQRAALQAQREATKAKMQAAQGGPEELSSMLMHTLALLEEERAKNKQKEVEMESTLRGMQAQISSLAQQNEDLKHNPAPQIVHMSVPQSPLAPTTPANGPQSHIVQMPPPTQQPAPQTTLPGNIPQTQQLPPHGQLSAPPPPQGQPPQGQFGAPQVVMQGGQMQPPPQNQFGAPPNHQPPPPQMQGGRVGVVLPNPNSIPGVPQQPHVQVQQPFNPSNGLPHPPLPPPSQAPHTPTQMPVTPTHGNPMTAPMTPQHPGQMTPQHPGQLTPNQPMTPTHRQHPPPNKPGQTTPNANMQLQLWKQPAYSSEVDDVPRGHYPTHPHTSPHHPGAHHPQHQHQHSPPHFSSSGGRQQHPYPVGHRRPTQERGGLFNIQGSNRNFSGHNLSHSHSSNSVSGHGRGAPSSPSYSRSHTPSAGGFRPDHQRNNRRYSAGWDDHRSSNSGPRIRGFQANQHQQPPLLLEWNQEAPSSRSRW